MKKLIPFIVYLILACSVGCNMPYQPEGYNYRRQITVETNLPEIRIDNIYLDSTTTYPHVIYDLVDNNNSTRFFTIYPVQDTGFIKLKLFGGKSGYERNPAVSFKDSLTIYTPIDTTEINIIEFQFAR